MKLLASQKGSLAQIMVIVFILVLAMLLFFAIAKIKELLP